MLTLETNLVAEHIGKSVEMILMIGAGQLKTAKNDNPFWRGTFVDKYRTVDACVWRLHKDIHDMGAGKLIHAMFNIKEFNSVLQLDVTKIIEIRAPLSEELGMFLRAPDFPKEKWMALYNEEVEPLIEDPPIKKLISLILAGKKFWRAPAAKGLHHTHIGGLGDHTYGLLTMFVGLVKSGHPQIKRSRKGLVIAGLVLHDFGKVWDYEEVAPGQFEYSRFLNLVGHLAGGPIFFARFMEQQGIEMSEELRNHFNHVLLAHHGQMIWGSPVEPKTIEAWIVHLLDMMDGKLWPLANAKDGEYVKILRANVAHFQG